MYVEEINKLEFIYSKQVFQLCLMHSLTGLGLNTGLPLTRGKKKRERRQIFQTFETSNVKKSHIFESKLWVKIIMT